MNFETLAALRHHLTVKHHIPGRIRLVFNPTILAAPGVQAALESQTDLPPGVSGVRINALARSVVLEYDPERILPDLLDELAVTRDNQRAVRIVEELAAVVG